MFVEQLSTAITTSTPNQLHHLSKEVWRAWAAGSLSDTDAQRAAEQIAERKRGIAGYPEGRNNAPTAFRVARVSFPKRKNQRSPDRRRSIERRRHLAASGGTTAHPGRPLHRLRAGRAADRGRRGSYAGILLDPHRRHCGTIRHQPEHGAACPAGSSALSPLGNSGPNFSCISADFCSAYQSNFGVTRSTQQVHDAHHFAK
jgi:hypothetical protein